MGGMREQLTSERTARDPRSRINRALAAWDCDEPELLQRKHVSKGIRPMKITSKMVGAEAKKNPDAAPYTVQWKSGATGRLQSSGAATKAQAVKEARALEAEGARNVTVSHYTKARGAEVVEWQKNPAARKWLVVPRTGRSYIVGAFSTKEIAEGYMRTLNAPWNYKIKRAAAERPARKPVAKPRANPAAAKLYTVHTVTGDGKPRDPIAHFRKRADALTYAKAYAKAYGAPVVLTGRAL